MTPAKHGEAAQTDVIIMGGGLAGLTLALQVQSRFEGVSITVLERNRYPVPEAAHKIGESSVEIGAHYFAEVLGLRDHLEEHQLRKFGFRFYFSQGERNLEEVSEIGTNRELAVPTFQIDRGVFENYLAELVVSRGIQLIEGATVREFELSEKPESMAADMNHHVSWTCDGQNETRSARWLIDSSGRPGLIKRKLGLTVPNEHNAHAVWFRVKGHITIDNWSEAPVWQERCQPPIRWMSTNHLVGKGYWLWLIPLSSGHHSVGIVADPRIHPIEQMSSFEKAMDWIETNQPRLFDELNPRREDLVDFAYFRNFSYGCKHLFSPARWALTGDAGLFLDPFYSPGSDFIAIANTMITELIARDLSGERIGAHAHIYNQLYQSFYDSTLALYSDQYEIFGDVDVLKHKVLWDYTYYWGVLSQLFFQRRLCDITALSHLRAELAHCQNLSVTVQKFLRAWAQVSDHSDPGVMHDQNELPWFVKLNSDLLERFEGDDFKALIRQSCHQLTQLARELAEYAGNKYPELALDELHAAIAGLPKSAGPVPDFGRLLQPVRQSAS